MDYYGYHTPLEYKILEKGKRYVHIQPLTTGYNKDKHQLIFYTQNGKSHTIELKMDKYDFWIKRKYIRRGPGSTSNTKDRWVWIRGFEQMLLNAYTKKNDEGKEENGLEKSKTN